MPAPSNKKATNFQNRVGYVTEWLPLFAVTGVGASQLSANIQNIRGHGVILCVKVANVGTSTWTPYIAIANPDNSTFFTIWTAAAAISANGITMYAFYPAQAKGSFTDFLSTILPKEIVVGATYGGSGNGDISAWIQLIP